MLFYVLFMRIKSFSVIKYGITAHPHARMKTHATSYNNPFGERPTVFYPVGSFSDCDHVVRGWELRLKRAALASLTMRDPDVEDAFYFALPTTSGQPSGEWLFKPAEPRDAYELVDQYNDLVVRASVPDVLMGFESAAKAVREFDELALTRIAHGEVWLS